ncbi:MAG: hypothetical protein H7A24_14530 [Leptospiraceae bacterium]|nr:hypothetical protein [Leptospiraceae bacterium]MCP5513099.1 hypothetical protein [Leptospiraceae bacterium]
MYTIVNFFVTGSKLGPGSTYKEGEKYYVSGRNTPKREIKEEEHLDHQRNVSRMFSGHWMLFYLASVMMLFPVDEKKIFKVIEEKNRKTNSEDLEGSQEDVEVEYELWFNKKYLLIFLMYSTIYIGLYGVYKNQKMNRGQKLKFLKFHGTVVFLIYFSFSILIGFMAE